MLLAAWRCRCERAPACARRLWEAARAISVAGLHFFPAMIVPSGRNFHLWFRGRRLHPRACSPASGNEVFVNATGNAGQEAERAVERAADLSPSATPSEALAQTFEACA